MSGFGSGFGSQPPQQPMFGSQQQSPSQPQQFGSGFGSTPTGGFGSTPTTQSVGGFGGGGGFGAAPAPGVASPFGKTSATAPSFGTSSNLAPMGSSGSGFGQSSGTFGTQASGFSSQTTPFSSGGGTGFGSTTGSTMTQSFGGASVQTPTSFDGTPVASQSTSFGQTTAASPFGQQSAPSTNATSPFGNTASSSPISFGASANVVPSSTQGFSSSATFSGGAPFTSTSFQSSSSQPTSFGASTSQFGSDNEDMGDSGDFSASPAPTFGTAQSSWPAKSLSPVPEQGSMADSSMSPTPAGSTSFSIPRKQSATTASADSDKKEEEEKLARLRARIQAKKKKLEEQKRRKERTAPIIPPPDSSSSLNAEAAPFTPSEKTSLAERNALRFASSKVQTTTKSQLPADLQDKSGTTGQADDGGGNDVKDLENAVSLVGTCLHMCPDDELLRREREGDIQLLEIPQPGTLHPSDWTLRDTAVKRFRRSAADYKLDVPEWIRPPDVLEKVCGYLEEWVMERDRQGIDPRFSESELQKSDIPPPLDVYQFIWDRTRMIRKDFILQNYVGTGGSCDARAVRTHERIARWHAMCEHQLSHIPDFVTMQSQQNIQELGQTMKTLNQYYDDALGRSVVEVADEEGKELRTSTSNGNHGCQSDIVMGESPVDFDGSPLNNDKAASSVSKRLIGKHAANSASRGTAEPEMRGLYILLTLNNEGGMEVLKYAGNLFRKRPEVYHSFPVQLALRVHKAKKDYNYARFFSILRSPSTPYLFACIMFKYVEQMRKAAFRIMSRTYGARRKDTGVVMYDAYPIQHLVRLLCFEDVDEARAACKHYNIAVGERQSSSGDRSIEVVLWRHSEFCENKDPTRGIVVPLKPRKMVRTIEKKLNGATRLAVCRGEVSGEGASLSSSASAPQAIELSAEELERQRKEEEEARAAALRAEEEKARRVLEEEKRRKLEEKRRRREEKLRQEAEKQRQAQLEKEKAEEAMRQELLLKKKREAELEKQRKKEEERMKREAEAAAAAAEERRRQEEAEARRIAAEQEAARKKAEEVEREKQRQIALQLKYEEEQRLLRLRKEQEERKRREEEARRLQLQQMQRQKEEEERKRKEEEERRIALEWERKINAARKLLVWRRWRQRLGRRHHASDITQESLRRIDLSFHGYPSLVKSIAEQNLSETLLLEGSNDIDIVARQELRDYLLQLGSERKEPLDLAKVLKQEIDGHIIRQTSWPRRDKERREQPAVLLCKLAVIFPSYSGYEVNSFHDLVHQWIDSRLQYGRVTTDRTTGIGGQEGSLELRVVVVNGHNIEARNACDGALFIIPPCPQPEGKSLGTAPTFARIDDSVPRIVLNLDDQSDAAYTNAFQNILPEILGDSAANNGIISLEGSELETQLDTALQSTCRALLKAFADAYPERTPCLDRVPLTRLGRLCIQDALWRNGCKQRTDHGDQILDIARATLLSLATELYAVANDVQDSRLSTWPAIEFADRSGMFVNDYFNPNEDLPLCWSQTLDQSSAEQAVMEFLASLNGSFRYVVENMLNRASLHVREECDTMIEKRQFRRCLESALMWREASGIELPSRSEKYIYLPKGMVQDVIDGAVQRVVVEDGADERHDVSSLRFESVEPRRHEEDAEGILALAYGNNYGETPHLTSLPMESEVVAFATTEPPHTDGNKHNMLETVDSRRPAIKALPTEKESYSAGTEAGFLRRSKRALDAVTDYGSVQVQGSKRRREEVSANLSKDQRDSQDFTKKLEALMNGQATIDVDVGNVKLSDLLTDVPSLAELPS